jgi:glycosyltransferase involved in cell wall biosynthesis
MNKKNIFIIMPAYKVEHLIEAVIKRIPSDIWKKVSQLVIINDGSPDNTIGVIKKLSKRYKKLHIIDKKINEGYARAQKTGFKYALKKGADIVVLLHSDGQYAPELLPKLLKPLEEDKADVVQGSRILGGKALQGKMPMYKYIANRILSILENLTYGMNVAEYHSGYMLYSKKALEKIPFEKLSNTFHFDGEMIFMSGKKGLKFKELPITTTYAGETSNLKPIQYGFDVLKIMWDYKMGKYDF